MLQTKRACVTCSGMRLAEQEMRLLIIKLLQNFRLEWPKDERKLGQEYVMLLKPDRPARIQFKLRQNQRSKFH